MRADGGLKGGMGHRAIRRYEQFRHVFLLRGLAHLDARTRPPFFFDILDEGEGVTDVGTHLVDLAHWTLFPHQALDYRQDIQVQGGKRWPTPITAAQYHEITGAVAFPAELAPYVHGDRFDYYCNNQVD